MPTRKRKAGRPRAIDQGRLLDAAEPLFAEKGFEGASIRDVAAQAGCNPAMISYYFGGKEGLYFGVIQRHLENTQRLYAGTVETDDRRLAREWKELDDPDARRFCASLFQFARYAVTHECLQKVIQRELMSGSHRLAKALSKPGLGMFAPLTAAIERLQAKGKLRKSMDRRLAVVSVLGPIIYCCISAPILREVYKFERVDEELMRGLCVHLTQALFSGYGA